MEGLFVSIATIVTVFVMARITYLDFKEDRESKKRIDKD